MTNYGLPENGSDNFSGTSRDEHNANTVGITPDMPDEAAHITPEIALGLAHSAQDLGQESLTARITPDVERAADYFDIAQDLGNAAASLADEAGMGVSLAFEDYFSRDGNIRPELDDSDF